MPLLPSWLLFAVATAPGGVVVESVQDGFAAERAGLAVGDELLGWERQARPPANPEPAAGTLRSPLDLETVEIEQAPRGELILLGTRAGRPVSFNVPLGEWRLEARPVLRPEALAEYEAGARLVAGGQQDQGLPRWREVALKLKTAGDSLEATWLYYRIGSVAARRQLWPAADDAFNAALAEAETSRDAAGIVRIRAAIGRSFEDRHEWERAVREYQGALEACGAPAVPSLAAARIERQLEQVAIMRGDLDLAEAHARRMLAITDVVAPDGLDAATAIASVAYVAWRRGDADTAEEGTRRGLAIRERLAPGSLDVAASLSVLGVLARSRGDLSEAEGHMRRSLEIRNRLAPGSLELASGLSTIGVLLRLRGDLVGAEDCQRRALEIREALAPGGLEVAGTLNNLGNVAWSRRDPPAAEALHKRALEIREKLAPRSQETSASLNNLGEIASTRGSLAEAEDYLGRALALHDELAPENLSGTRILQNLGEVAWKRGRPVEARGYMRRAMEIQERQAPRGLAAAYSFRILGDFDLASGDLDGAEARFQQCLDILKDLTPGSADEAEAYHRLAVVARRRGRPEQALERYLGALAALDSQQRNLGGSDEAKSRFTAGYAAYYRATVELLMDLGRPAEAFHVLERYRARAFLALLAERDLVFSADVPADLDRERRVANAEYDRALARLVESKAETVADRREALGRVRLRQAAIQDRIRAASARLAALQYPEALDLSRAREALSPGTLMLSYVIGDERSYVFAIGPGPEDFTVRALDIRLPALRVEVGRFRELLQSAGTRRRGQLELVARRLSDALLAPMAPLVARATRLVVVPDGPLHLIPFGALTDPGASEHRRFLVEARPVSVVASATVLSELRKRRRPDTPAQLVGFGDPDYSNRSGPALQALPASREELRGIERLYPGASRTYLGPEATEERAKQVGAQASLVHLACHGFADEQTPLDSYLALSFPERSQPERDNGLLQAWEVFEQVRVTADLVTLSGCGTALGKEMSGEGVLGLTRAFQHAGARSVLASLWEVNDASTARLMAGFYGYLRAGQEKDAALRAAQLDLLREPRSQPRLWAPFQLVGDWQ